MGWRGAGQEVKRRLGTSQGAGDLWVHPALLPSWSLVVLGVGGMLRAAQGTLCFTRGSVGSSSPLPAQGCCAAQKLRLCLQAKSVVSKRS